MANVKRPGFLSRHSSSWSPLQKSQRNLHPPRSFCDLCTTYLKTQKNLGLEGCCTMLQLFKHVLRTENMKFHGFPCPATLVRHNLCAAYTMQQKYVYVCVYIYICVCVWGFDRCKYTCIQTHVYFVLYMYNHIYMHNHNIHL